MTSAEARFSNSLCPRKPEGLLGRTAQDVHLDSHTAPELTTEVTIYIYTPPGMCSWLGEFCLRVILTAVCFLKIVISKPKQLLVVSSVELPHLSCSTVPCQIDHLNRI